MNATNLITLYEFCDGSQKTYAAEVYARTNNIDEQCPLSFLTARIKIPPLNGATIS